MPNRQDLSSKLAKARQQLQQAQTRVAALEAQLSEEDRKSTGILHQENQPSEHIRDGTPDETALQESAQQLNLFVEHAPAALAMLDNDMRYLLVSQRWLKDYRLHETDVVGRSHYELFPDLPEGWKQVHKRCLAGAVERSEADPFPRADGSLDWVRWEIRPWRKADGSIGGIFILSEVITERKQAEAAAERYAKRMEILHQIDIGILNSNSIPAVIEMALRHIRQIIPCQRANVSLIDLAKGERVVLALDYDHATELGQELRIPLAPDFFEGFDARHTKLIPDLRVLQDSNPRFKQAVDEGLLSALNIILMNHEQPVGTLALFADTTDFFTSEYQEIAIEIGNQLAIAVRQLRMSEELTQYTATLEQKVAERASDLQTALMRVEAILNNSPDGILLAHSNLNIQQTNSSFNGLFGCTWDDYFGQSVLTLLHTDDADRVCDFVKRTTNQQNETPLEVRAIRKDGTTFDAELSTGRIKGDGLVCVIRDIGERKAQERQLRYYASIQESVSDAVIATDTEFRIQSWNKAAEHVYGWTVEEAVGKVAPEFLHIRFPSAIDRETGRQQFNKQGSLQQETIQRRKDGTDIFILGSATRLEDKNGAPIGIIAVNRDITERKAQEQQLRYHASIQESVSDAVIVTDTEFRIQSWNRAAEMIYGWTAEEVIGKSVAEVLQTVFESEEQTQRTLRDFLEKGGWQGEVIQHSKDGKPLSIHGSVSLLKDENNQPYGVVSVNRDISDRKRAEETIARQLADEQQFQIYLKVLHEIIIELTQIDDLDAFYRRTVELGRERLGFERLAMFLYDELDGRAMGTYGTDPQGNLTDERGVRFKPDPNGIMLRAFERSERFYFNGQATLFSDQLPIGNGWNVATVLWNGTRSLGWFVADNLLTHAPASKPLLDIIGLYALSVGTLLAQKQVQIALKESEALYRLLAENISDLIMRSSLTSECLYVSPSLQTILGYTPEEIIGQQTFSLIHPDDQSTLWEAYASAIERSDSIPPHRYRAKHKDGHYVWLETVGRPIFKDGSDEMLGVITSSRDITERRKSEEALRDSEERFRQIAENIDQTLFMRSSDDEQVLYISPRYEQMWEQPVETIYEKPLSYIDAVHPDDRDYVNRQRLTRRYLEQGFADYEYRLLLPEDRIRWVRVRTFPIKDDAGVIIRRAGAIEDITERKRAEVALRESEEKFRLLLDAAPVATVISDQTGRIILVNGQAETLLGYERSELAGQMVEVLVPAYASRQHEQKRMTYLAKPRVRPMGLGMELYARRKDGSEIPVEIELSHIETRDGGMVMSFIMDITERKRTAAELEQQRSFLRNVIDVSPSMIFVKDFDGRFILVNPSVANAYNTTIEGMLGKMDADFNPVSKEVDDYLAADRLVITSGKQLFVEEPITNTFGKRHWLQTTKVPIISADGKSKYVLGVSTDITERREAEEALRESEENYRSLVETMHGGLAVFDTEFRVTYVNDRFCQLMGYTREEAVGLQPTDLVDEIYHPLVHSHLERLQNAESTSYEIPLRHKNGTPIFVLLSGSPLLDEAGKYSGSFVVATDISIQKQAEDTLRQALGKEKELGDLKTRFVSMASHEFRTPLATIMALVETLSAYRQKLSEDQIEQRFTKIKDQVNHLKDIMEDVLMLARMQARRVEFNPVKLDLDALCRSVLDEFESRADIQHLLEYTVDDGLHEVRLDRKLMRQIISNLVSNAIKYSPDGKVVRINLEHRGMTVILKVSDEGIGIPDTDLPHLFEPFHRAANVGAISGTGLGLVITKESVDLHEGTITVDSRPGIGTTFTIQIPVSDQGGIHGNENPGH